MIIPKTQAGNTSGKSLRPKQSKLRKSCQSETSKSSEQSKLGKSCQSETSASTIEVSNVFAEQSKTKSGPEQSIGLFRKKGNENFTKVLAITEDLQHCKDLQHEALSVQDPLDTLQATLQNTISAPDQPEGKECTPT